MQTVQSKTTQMTIIVTALDGSTILEIAPHGQLVDPVGGIVTPDAEIVYESHAVHRVGCVAVCVNEFRADTQETRGFWRSRDQDQQKCCYEGGGGGSAVTEYAHSHRRIRLTPEKCVYGRAPNSSESRVPQGHIFGERGGAR